MEMNQDDWNRVGSLASQNLSKNFAERVVQHAQRQRRFVRQRKTMLVTCVVCVLSFLVPTWVSKYGEHCRNTAQWNYLYVKNEIMRTSL